MNVAFLSSIWRHSSVNKMNRQGQPAGGDKRQQQLDQLSKGFRQFPLSPYMLLASMAFWTLLTYASFKGIQYFGVHRRLDDTDLVPNCPVKFGATVEENIIVVENYTGGESTPYVKRIGSQKFSDSFIGDEAPVELKDIPPIVTAVTSADFYNLQRIIEQTASIAPKKNIKLNLIVYDLGLYSKEAALIKKHCNCEFRTFEWSVYPYHVSDMNIRAWMPIIIQMILEEFGSVMWIDPSASINNVQELNQFKYRAERSFFLYEYPIFTAINAYTNPKMFKHLNEKRCTFVDLGMMDTRVMVLYRTKQTWYGIMKPWLKCALTKDCIAPDGARRTECFHYKRPKSTGCHWYEQSIFSIIINRVFQFTYNSDKFKAPHAVHFDDTELVYYFPEQPWTYTQIFLIFTLPPMVLVTLWYLKKRRDARKRNKFYNR
ncbi:unnamed protein product [Mytilus coruscus]|uniref:Uncharacterized protein n=1 Tax=Mytilus coruscus TaxID=42192 RepID=A0A6J8BE99_MYTCO|nr:unnamed protein product [Mytilus coruscus]